jgi:hypothetical protein
MYEVLARAIDVTPLIWPIDGSGYQFSYAGEQDVWVAEKRNWLAGLINRRQTASSPITGRG